ncbi:MAG: bifunctional diaminohydroxyphosphoribosylaminopyrimidine deaminase/5-amino-6-(5-phosphoribosylamino)uracil reductase RibD [Proteobacteria bacterium]|nr:bifunctional diaminohydroxyphosphoribosylaminopyrimidine deaminase/5-amino-6-(5-phosphoribosylamino)uracil reductase RibD [Pseudomonadota bacterium]
MAFRLLEDQFRERLTKAKAADMRFMQLALALGRRGLGTTSPNPAVGAVVVRDGVIVGRGWTQPGGRPHAEVEALRRAGEAARGATLYVTLEPCSHVGKSPPCADAVITAGIARVVSAIEDPNPEVAGQGHARLRAAGISVDVGLAAEEAARDHAGHFRRVRDKRPHVILKLAVSSDDRIAAAGGKPVAITGDAAKARVHLLRAQCDAILVGIGTVLADDPLLTCRLPGMAARSPVRVVLDRALRIPGGSRLVHSARETPLWVVGSETAEAMAAARLSAAGAEVLRVISAFTPAQAGIQKGAGSPLSRGRAEAMDAANRSVPLDLAAVLAELNRRGITRLMVEGGSRVASSFVAADLADEIWLLRGAHSIGADGVPALHALPLSSITQSPRFKVRASEMLQNDTLTIYGRA